MQEGMNIWWMTGVAVVIAVALLACVAWLMRRLRQSEGQRKELEERLATDVTELKRQTGKDPLTGIANRRVFDQVLKREWVRAARSKQPLAIIMTDIDRFKMHNDKYGHQAGDECIRQVSAVLKYTVRRPADLVARYGGEEFGVILPNANIAGASAVAERMRQAVEALKLPHVNNPTGPDVTISLGVAVQIPDTHASPDVLVAAADEALYRAKAVGRNQVIVAGTSESENETIRL